MKIYGTIGNQPCIESNLYLSDLKSFGAENIPLDSIEELERVIAELGIKGVMFGFYGFPRRIVTTEKALRLFKKLLAIANH